MKSFEELYIDIKKQVNKDEKKYNELHEELELTELKIAESKNYVVVLQKDKDENSSILSPYSKEDIIDEHIKEEENTQVVLKEIICNQKKSCNELEERIEQNNEILQTIEPLIDNTILTIETDRLNKILDIPLEYEKENIKCIGSLKDKIDTLIYLDPERVKQEMNMYIKQVKSNKKMKEYKKEIEELKSN